MSRSIGCFLALLLLSQTGCAAETTDSDLSTDSDAVIPVTVFTAEECAQYLPLFCQQSEDTCSEEEQQALLEHQDTICDRFAGVFASPMAAAVAGPAPGPTKALAIAVTVVAASVVSVSAWLAYRAFNFVSANVKADRNAAAGSSFGLTDNQLAELQAAWGVSRTELQQMLPSNTVLQWVSTPPGGVRSMRGGTAGAETIANTESRRGLGHVCVVHCESQPGWLETNFYFGYGPTRPDALSHATGVAQTSGCVAEVITQWLCVP